MRIQHNIMAMNAYRNYTNNVSAMQKNLEKLSSGYKINRAGDDAAGLAISEKMRAQITGLETAQKNAKDGISLIQTAEGALTEVHDMLNRMVELASQSANGTYDNSVDRAQMEKELNQLRSEINRIADSSNFNGINLLDGSLDANKLGELTDASAISGITSEGFTAAGASPAFEHTYITNRPEAATKQLNASFTVSLDDLTLTGLEAGDKFKLTIGDATLEYTAVASDVASDATGTAIERIAAGLVKSGLKAKADKTLDTHFATQTNSAVANELAATDKWAEALGAGAKDADSKYVKIDGHYWQMEVDGTDKDLIKFTQVDTIGDAQNVNPDYTVKAEVTDAATTKELRLGGTTNWQVQQPTTGVAIGSSHQAQVQTTIDFSKLKDGDRLVVGEKSFVFKIGENSTTAVDTTNHKGDTLVDLHEIFKVDSDLLDAEKQAKALDVIVKGIEVDKDGNAVSGTWSAGNGGVADGKGTITFQSLSSYDGDATGGTKKYIESNDDSDTQVLCDMRTEDTVMKQFYSLRDDVDASTSFDVDVTKLKAGDTFTIDGTTFEFTDGDYVTNKDHEKINLEDFGIEGGIQSSKEADVMDAIKTAVDNALGSTRYTTSVDGNTFKIAATDDGGTTVKENRKTPVVELANSAYTTGKSLTLQIGDTADDFNMLKVNVKDCHTEAMGIADISIADQESAQKAVDVIKSAINYVSDIRGDLGATQNRLDHTINNLSVMTENIQDAESTIRDVDVAEEMMAYTKNNILIQSAQAMLAQANQVPQGVLQLLG